MSTAFVDLCDDDSSSSSSDEDGFSIARRCRSSPTKRLAAPTTPGVLELWDSSDDDNSGSPSKKAKRNPRRDSQVVTPENLKSLDSNQEDDDVKPRRPPRTLFPTTTTTTRKQTSYTSIRNNDNSKKTKKSTSPLTCMLEDSDSDEDDLLLSCHHGVFKKKATTNTALTTSASDARAKSESVDRLITTTTAATKPPVIYNPYSNTTKLLQPQINKPHSTDDRTVSIVPNIGAGRMHYEDIRPRLLVALWKYSRTLVHASYNLTKLDSYCKKINALALSEFPIRSVEEYTQRFCRTCNTSVIKEALTQGGYYSNNSAVPVEPPEGLRQYYSIAEACLVAMYEALNQTANHPGLSRDRLDNSDTDWTQQLTFLQQKTSWVYLSDLLLMIDQHLKPYPTKLSRRSDDDNGAAFYTNPSTRSSEYKQVEKLAADGYIKYHKHNTRVCYELTLKGCQTAMRLTQRSFPAPNGYYRTSHQPALRGGANSDIWLAVDHREGGGGTKQLHTMCDTLDRVGISYLVTKLDIGDYCFFASVGAGETSKLLPILIERKSIQDVAQSIHDGRWTSQKRRMYQGQFVFGYDACRLAYIIEGAIEPQQVTGGFIGDRQFNVSRERLEEALEQLESEGFDVLRTNNTKHSMSALARWATRVSNDYKEGTIHAQFTYDEFLSKVRAIPNATDFSRIAKDKHRERKMLFPSFPDNEAPVPVVARTRIYDNIQKATANPKVTMNKNTSSSDNQSKSLFQNMKLSELKKKCEEWGLPKTGTKDVLIARLRGPRPPEEWLKRKALGLYVPTRHDTCGTAILVGLWLQQRKEAPDWKGMSKDELYTLAESLQISKEPFTGVPGRGPHAYDGWSAMPHLKEGEAPLIFRNKGGYFKLTSTNDLAGMSLAEAMHEWCHDHNRCDCQQITTL